MAQQSQQSADRMLMREALRGARHVLRRARVVFFERLHAERLPRPAALVARKAMRECGAISTSIDEAATGLAKRYLGVAPPSTPTLSHFAAQEDGPGAFAVVFYRALKSVLGRLGAPRSFVSEAIPRNAYAETDRSEGETDARWAARLTLRLLEAKALCATVSNAELRVSTADLRQVAVFAVLLWLQSERTEGEDEAALFASVDVSVALARDIALACSIPETQGIEELYARFAAHI